MTRDISQIPFQPCSVYYVPEIPTNRIRQVADCSCSTDAADIAEAMRNHLKLTYISTDETGKPTVWEPVR